MAIVYDKLFALLKEKGVTTYKLRKEGIIGNATYTAIKNGKGGLDYRSINRLCEALDCQPGDIMEYVRDNDNSSKSDQPFLALPYPISIRSILLVNSNGGCIFGRNCMFCCYSVQYDPDNS